MSAPTRTGTAATNWAKGQAAKPSRNWNALCLQFVRSCYGVAAREPNAKQGWLTAKRRHATTDADSIPAGVPVWWKTGTVNWHVAISLGSGDCYSTDVPRGKVGRIGINALSRAWGATLLGWSEDINGVTVYTAPKPAAKPSVSLASLIRAAKGDPARSDQRVTYAGTRTVERALVAEGLLATSLADGHFGRATVTAYAAWQRKLGYRGKDADGIPGKTSLGKLGAKHGFRVVAS